MNSLSQCGRREFKKLSSDAFKRPIQVEEMFRMLDKRVTKLEEEVKKREHFWPAVARWWGRDEKNNI
jgi:hypothetical protein